jgi:hypothetical protein
MPFLLLFPSAKARDPLYPFREFSGERSLQVVLNAVMKIFVQLYCCKYSRELGMVQ